MARTEIYLPAMGEGVIEATITQILKSVGDVLEEDDAIFEIATDKVDSEVPAPCDGTLSEILVHEADTVKVGQLIAVISDGNPETESTPETPSKSKVEETTIKKEESTKPVEISSSNTLKNDEITSFLSPLVKAIIVKEGLTSDEVNSIKGSGAKGRVTKDDVLKYIENRTETPINSVPIASNTGNTQVPLEIKVDMPIATDSSDEIIEMDRMRKLIAQHMVHSVQTSPHVTSFVETDLTNIVNWRNRNKNKFLKREGEKLTFMPIFIEAMAKAIKDFPMINASIDGDNIIIKKNVNIGMAAALPNGNLIVPVIKNADHKNLTGLAKNVNDLANRSRNNKLQPDEIQGSTITITNMGTFGNTTGTPIINQPNVAILAVGAIIKKPAVIETPQGDTIGIRHKMTMALSYDHRVVDGALGGMYLKKVSDYLENFSEADIDRV